MYNSNNRQFVLKQTSGKVWNIYYDNRFGLCYSILTKRNTWTEPVSLKKNVFKSFYADIDPEDRIHIIFQDDTGNIFYSKLDDQSINTVPVLNSKASTPYNKHLRVIPLKNDMNFFYMLRHNNSNILAHQVLSSGNVNAPKVIDYVIDNNCPYSVVCDRTNNIYVFYQYSDGKYNQMGYKKYLSPRKFWGEFTPVTRFDGNSELPRTVVDNNNIIHISYQRQNGRQYELVYQQKVPEKNLWSNETVIFSSSNPFPESSVACIDENIIVYWVRDDIIYYSFSNDQGNTWSKPSRYNFPVGRQLICISYKTNVMYENDKLFISDIPGSFANGIKMAFHKDGEDGSNMSPDKLRKTILESLKLLKESIEELREFDRNLEEKISKLSFVHQDIQKELAKNSVKLSYIENELKSKLSPGFKDLNTLKESLLKDITGSSAIQKNTADIQKLADEIESLKNTILVKKFKVRKSTQPDSSS